MKTWWKCFWVVVVCLLAGSWVWAKEAAPGQSAPSQTEGTPSTVSTPSVPMEQTPHWSILYLGAAASAGVIILGAAYGIAKIGASAVENMARQPEVANSINTAMVVSAALIEGVTFFALIVCLLSVFFK